MLESLRVAAKGWPMKIFLVILGLSFAVWGVTGAFNTSISGTEIIKAGGSSAGASELSLAYNRQINNVSRQFGRRISQDQAAALGLDRQALNETISGVVLDEEARQLGLGLSSQKLAELTGEDQAFHDLTGNFSRRQFDLVLREIGMTANEYLASRSKAAQRQQIVDAVSGGVAAPAAFLEAQALYDGESRTIDYIILPDRLAGEIERPDDATLESYFKENMDRYNAPEYRKFSFVTLQAEDLIDETAITDEQIAADYEARKDRYTTPEKREISQIVFDSLEDAQAAAKQLAEGKDFVELAKEHGKTAQDINLGVIEKSALSDPAVAEAAFGLAGGGPSNVIEGSFGPVIVNVTQIVPAAIRSLEQEKDNIRKQLALNDAARIVPDIHDVYEDARASGSTIAEAAEQAELQVTVIEAIDQQGLDKEGNIVADLPNARELLREVFATQKDLENRPLSYGSNGFIWYEVDELEPTRPHTLDEVREQVVEDWIADEREMRLKAKADELAKRIEAGDSLEAIAAELSLEASTKSGLVRNANDGELGEAGVDAVFEGPEGSVVVADMPTGDGKLLMKVTQSIAPAGIDAEAMGDEQKQPHNFGLLRDLEAQLISQLQVDYPVTVNQRAVDYTLRNVR